jgi:branched-chain amino acid transport system substrate-binding protein
MTGSEATFGQSTHNGLALAVDEINAAGGIKGKKVRLVSYDDQGKTSEVGTAVTRLITEDHVLAVIGEVASSLSIAGGQIAQQHGVPMISPSSTNPTVTETGEYVFRVCFIDPFQGYVMARFATDPKEKSGLGVKRVAVLVDNRQAYSQGLAKNFSDALAKLGGTVVANEKYQGGDQDFSAQLTRIKEQSPEALFIPGYYTDVANIAKQVRAIGIAAPLLGGDGWESVTDIGGDAIQGAYYSNHYAPDEPRTEVKAFVDQFGKRFAKTPDSMAALAFDSMMLLKSAIERAPAIDHKNVRDAIAQTKDFQGVTGKITIDGNRNATKPAVVLKITGKTTVAAASIAPQ